MGIKLDWEIETEQSTVQDASEDRLARRRRRMALLRFLLGIMIFLAVIGGLYGLVWWRLQTIDGEIERALIDTVDAEVATLRVADKNSFLDIQRSASDTWRDAQGATFDEYQRLKVEYDVQLTGNVVEVEVDGTRGRVQIEEIIDGVPYVQTWFYWRYAEDGWRHVPPDYTFWGKSDSLERSFVTVSYQSMDEIVAQAVADSVNEWLKFACSTIGCDGLGNLNLQILPRQGSPVLWSETDPTVLQIPSPFVSRARLDRPFDTALQVEVATLLAERIVNQAAGDAQPLPQTDAAFLRQSAQSWLVAQFTQVDTQSHLFSTYAERYGNEAIGNAVRGLSPNASLQTLSINAGAPSPADLEVDWRDYLSWRLNLEVAYYAQRDEVGFVNLYDTRDPNIADLALSRFNAPLPQDRYEAIAIQKEFDETGSAILRSVARQGEGDAASDNIVQFRLVDNVWKRIN